MRTTSEYTRFFTAFFRIGLFTLGGGYAMLPLIEEEVVNRRKWISGEEFVDLVAVAQAVPGVFAVNMSINIGYRLRRTRGAVCCMLGCVLPSFLTILAIALFFHNFRGNNTVEAIFKGIRPAIAALIAVPCIRLARAAKATLRNAWLPVGAALLICVAGVPPVYIVLAAGAGGYLHWLIAKPRRGVRGAGEDGKTP